TSRPSSLACLVSVFPPLSQSRPFLLSCLSMTRRPPRSTLFPTRRSSDLVQRAHVRVVQRGDGACLTLEPIAEPRVEREARAISRSEEHTSELQSRRDLVCRLLLEKKKRKTIITPLLINRYEQDDD